MSGTTISGTYLTSVTLSNAATQNPMTIAAGATLGGGLVGAPGTYWTVSNSGVVNNSSIGTIGISLAGGGDVSNTTGAAIAGTSYGIIFGNGGHINNAGQASIQGGVDAVLVDGSAGTVMNSGIIGTTQTASGVGVYLAAGGAVTNVAFASITGGLYGVEVAGGEGTVVNSGTIAGDNKTGSIGVYLKEGGALTNSENAVVTAGKYGVDIRGGTGTILNDGTIAATLVRTVAGSLNQNAAIYLQEGGSVTNSASGVIKGQYGIYATSGLLTVVNLGTIAGAVNLPNHPRGFGISGGIGVDMFVTNAASASITGQFFAIDVGRGTGTVVNAGSIYGHNIGVDAKYIYNAAGATIQALGTGVYYKRIGQLDPTVINAGTITGRYAGIDVSGGTVINQTSGSIVSLGTDNAAASVTRGGVLMLYTGTVANYGAITADSAVGVKKFGVHLRDGGYVTNAASASITGYDGIYAGKVATVINSGRITGEFGSGISLNAGGFVTNTVSASIAGGVYVDGLAAVYNAGSITSRIDGTAVVLEGGSLTNTASGSIQGGYVGVRSVTAITLLNSGTISGQTEAGVVIEANGRVVNSASGLIEGGTYGLAFAGDGGTVINSGTITTIYQDAAGHGINLRHGGSITNGASALIKGAYDGVYVVAGSATIVNAGSIVGTHGVGIAFGDGVPPASGAIINSAGGLIEGGTVGIKLDSGGTVTNAGTITGHGGNAVAFYGTTSGRVVLDAGAVFNGNVVGSTSASNTLELASGTTTGTIRGIGSSFVNFGSVLVDSGARWELTGANNLASGSTLTNSGTLALSGATLSDAGGVVNNGRIELDPSTLNVASLTGTGTVTIDTGSTLAVQGVVSAGQDIVFKAVGGEFDLGTPLQFSGTISGFADGDTIDLISVPNVAGSHADMDDTTNVLTVTEGGQTYQFQFDKAEHFAGDFFHLVSQGSSTLIEENQIACYRRGTLIATEKGEEPVESLAIGDPVLTASGAMRPIKWIGRRSYGGRFILGRKDILPICLTAGSLAEGVPRRDLWISPHHAMALDGVLIEAKDLVNGVSIMQATDVEEVEYFHVELDSHDVILAEGAPSETFVDDDSRLMFHNAHEYAALYPEEARRSLPYCAPRLDIGHEVEAIRQKLTQRAGITGGQAAEGGALRGFVDAVSEGGVEGWAQNTERPEAPVCLDVFAGGRLVGQTLANLYREDLRVAGLGSGRHAFAFRPDRRLLSPASVEVRRSLDGATLKRRAGLGCEKHRCAN